VLYKYCIIIISPLASYSSADLSDARVFFFFYKGAYLRTGQCMDGNHGTISGGPTTVFNSRN